ncbi:G-type lectin S-receptor-like serine/threonine-protein kinase At2g19130 [Phragmites australis]|uniref:G-type lectin S-receptor-like serine/threonine-protein kinase At2g19130 n=1 Tax=Phragmites australis TaxID=29695 RepID=UPI002D7A3C8D|nr:G-type lectin S-receptor-like serine/threonine-protein kinase At2g19130 [Phragmites australis]
MPPLSCILLLAQGLLLFSSLHTPSCSAATKGDTLMAGQVLAVGDKLVSRNGKFALGFFQPEPTGIISKPTVNTATTSSSPGWYLGIWFNKIPVFTTVWVANREKPIADPELKLTQLKISRDGNLVIILNNASTESIIWSTTIVNRTTQTSTNATSVVLMNTGNLALIAESPSSNILLWQSFDYPVDVGLPGAKLGWNKVTGLNRQYISKKSLIDPGLGSYSIELDTDGVVLLRRHYPPSVVYWSWSAGKLSYELIPVLKSLLNMKPQTKGLFNPLYVENNEEKYFTYTLLNESSSTFVSIDISGQIKLNVWSQVRQSWETIYAEPEVPCLVSATCGPFTICNDKSSPFCDCMESFSQKSPRDWELGDRTGGCVRNTPLDCTASKKNTSSTDMFHPIARVTLPLDSQTIGGATTQNKCAEACLNDCSCTAYSYNNSICSVWHGKLLNVNLNDVTDITAEDVLYLRLSAKDLQSLREDNKRKPNVGVIVATASITSFGLLMLILLLMVWRNKFKWFGVPLHGTHGSGGIVALRYTDLCHATKNFSEKLGGGGFGSVFKGVLSDSTSIAVKRLDGARQGEKQFRAEVSSIGLIQHINLVKLIGFCCEGDKRLLVYEHMLNGSLDAHLFQSSSTVLTWITRYRIAIGVAKGLSYLHQSCRECIIHCDIKPQNILLDASFVPKIADFGMATIVGRDFSRVLTTFRGTAGYLAPEWLSGVAITPKVDVYSFGMVLLEIISGTRNSHEVYTSSSCHVAYFPVQAINKLHEGDVQSLVDPQLHGDFNLEEAVRICKVACWCIQDNESDRPTMGEVVQVLEGLQELDMPPMPRLLAAITKCSDVA